MRVQPANDRDNAKRIILGILQEARGSLYGTTRLYKAFYLAHLYHHRDHEGFLTRWPVVHMPHGPGVELGLQLIEELEAAGLITVSRVANGPYTEQVYRQATAEPVRLSDAERSSIVAALAWIGDRSASELTAEAHEYSRSWRSARDGEELAIYEDLLSDDDAATMVSSLDCADREVRAVFGS